MIVTSIWQAFKKGKELKQAGALKNIDNVAKIFVAIISAVIAILRVLGIDLPLTDKDVIVLAGGIASILFVVSSVITVISSSKVSANPFAGEKTEETVLTYDALKREVKETKLGTGD